MDILGDLSKAVGEEDVASQKLWEARSKTRALVNDNLTKLADMGVIKISVNRQILGKILGVPRTKTESVFR